MLTNANKEYSELANERIIIEILQKSEKLFITNSDMLQMSSIRRHWDCLENFDIIFDKSKYFFLLGANSHILKTIRNWWWNRKKKIGFLTTKTGVEIIEQCGCLLRFLISLQPDEKKDEYISYLFELIIEQIKMSLTYSRWQYINVISIKYLILDQSGGLTN
jgi:hypothetical protein